jgi:hypothetical protein
MLGRRVRRDFVAGFLQAAFDGSPKRRIIIDNVNNTQQDASPIEIAAKTDNAL